MTGIMKTGDVKNKYGINIKIKTGGNKKKSKIKIKSKTFNGKNQYQDLSAKGMIAIHNIDTTVSAMQYSTMKCFKPLYSFCGDIPSPYS